MPLAGLGLIFTVVGAVCVVAFLGGLLQHCAEASRARRAAHREANRQWPAPPPDIELGTMGSRGGNHVWIDGELMAVRGGPRL